MEIQKVPLALVVDHPDNYNVHDADQIRALRASLSEFGLVRPILVRPRNGHYVTIAGHGVTQAAREEQWTEISVIAVPAHWTDQQCRDFLVADNRLGALSHPDEAQLQKLLQGRKDAGYELLALGYDEQSYQRLMDEVIKQAQVQEAMEGEKEEQAQQGNLLALIAATIGEPIYQVESGDCLTLSASPGAIQHWLLCVHPFTDWTVWMPLFRSFVENQTDVLFLPFAGPFAVLSQAAERKKLFLLQPDTYIAGHMVDRFLEVNKNAVVTKKLHAKVTGNIEQEEEMELLGE